MKTISIEVSDPVADKIARMSPLERKAVSEKLNRLIENRKSLEDIMEEASEQAKRNNLTPQKLDEILKGE